MNALVRTLAAARLTTLVVDDEITKPVRAAIQQRAQDSAAWDTVDTGVNCHACASVWAAGGILVAEQGGPVGRFLVKVLALSQTVLVAQDVIERIGRRL